MIEGDLDVEAAQSALVEAEAVLSVTAPDELDEDIVSALLAVVEDRIKSAREALRGV